MTASLAWLDFTPQWCTLSGRASFGGEKIPAEQCKEKCKDGCLGVEWWEKSRSCYECTDPSKKTAYTHTNDAGYPPHVFLKIWQWTVFITSYAVTNNKNNNHAHDHHHHRHRLTSPVFWKEDPLKLQIHCKFRSLQWWIGEQSTY